MHQMFERTDLCPYTDLCESFQTICRAESWMEQELARLRRDEAQGLPSGDRGHSMRTLQGRLVHLRRVKERCHGYNGRCLRFWQFKAKEEEETVPHRRNTAWPPQFLDELVQPLREAPADRK